MKRRVRRARNEQPVPVERWRPGVVHLLGVALLLTIVAAFLRDDNGLRLGLPGAYVWVTALVIAFGLVLVHYARFVLPPEAEHEGARGWQEGLRDLVYYFGVMRLPPVLRRRFHRRREGLPPELPSSFTEFQAGFVDSHLAIALARGIGHARAVGPGYVRLNRGERVSHVVDLRRQVRRQEVEAFSRDGIRVETSIAVTFRVSDNDEQNGENVPFPYDPNCIFRLTYSDGVGVDSEIPWSERIAPQAASLLVAEIARYRLDQLYRLAVHDTDDAVSMGDLVQRVGDELEKELLELFDCSGPEDCPVKILSVSVGQLKPPDGVIDQRIRNWQSVWEKRKTMDEAESAAFEIREIQRARAKALAELIEHVTCNVEEMRNGDRETISKVLRLRMTDMLDRLIADQRMQVQTPQHVFDTLSKASTWLRELPPGDEEI